MARDQRRSYDVPMRYALKLYGPAVGGSTVRNGIGEIPFMANGDLAAIAHTKDAYAERLADCGYAMLLDEHGKLVWEATSPDA
jgi:hypothetical protein